MAIAQFDPSDFNHQIAICGGYKYHYVDEGPRSGIPVILIHGFPDLWYGWRHQIQFLVGLSRYRVIALDMLGYGESDKPRQSESSTNNTEYHHHHPAYSVKTLASHVVTLMDQLSIGRAVMVGHDWGTGIVSRIGWHFADRVLAAIAIGNPFRPVAEHLVAVEDYVKENPAFQYFEYFASPEAVEDFNERVEDIVIELFSEENGNSDEDRAYYLQSFKKGGFQGPLSYYKTFETSYQEDRYLVGKRFTIPTLLLIVNNDPILTPEYCRQVNTGYFDHLEIEEIEFGEHWVLTQNPHGINKKIGDYLNRLEIGATTELDDCRSIAALPEENFDIVQVHGDGVATLTEYSDEATMSSIGQGHRKALLPLHPHLEKSRNVREGLILAKL